MKKEPCPRKATTPHSPPRTATMQLRNGKRKLDAYQPTFDPNLDIATVVFSHVQCVKTRHSLALVSKLWRDASKTAAAYPLRFDFDAFTTNDSWKWCYLIIDMMDNDEAMSLPYERVVGLLGEAAEHVCEYSAFRGCVRLLRWTRENNLDWCVEMCSCAVITGHLPALKYLHENGCPWNLCTCYYAAQYGHLFVLQYLHENGCPWDEYTCSYAATCERWNCLQYAVDNKCPGWEVYTKEYAKHLR